MNSKKLLQTYTIGFITSLFLTGLAFLLAFIHIHSAHKTIPHSILIPLLLTLAVTQMFVQLIFFMHLWREKNPRWNLFFFTITFGIIFIVVVGSIWIMQHLNYHMTPIQMQQYVQSQDGF